MRTLSVDPQIPFALWWPLAVLALVLLVGYGMALRRRLARGRWGVVLGLMAAAVTVPLLLLLNPTWLDRIPPPEGKPLLTILVDRSGSMATADAPDGTTRFQAAARAATETASALADRYEVRVRAFAEDWTPVASADLTGCLPDGAATDLAAAVEQALDESRAQGQAMLLLSDGIDNAASGGARLRRVAARARALAAPIYAHPLGGPAEVDDLEVSLHLPQELAFVAQTVPVSVSVRQRGRLADQTRLTLSLGGQTVESRTISLARDGVVEEVFHVAQAAAGVYRYTVHADAVAGEVTEVNNRASLLVRVVDEPVRVLLLEGKPYWDTKFLIRTLSDDPSIELTSIVRMAEGRLLERVTARGRRPTSPDPPTPGERADAAATTDSATTDSAPPDAATADSAAPDSAAGAVESADRWSVREDAAAVLADAGALSSYQIVLLGRDAEVFLTDAALRNLRRWLAEESASLVCYRGAPTSQVGQRLGELMPVRWSPAGESRYRVQMTEAGRALRWLTGDQPTDPLALLPSLATASRIESVQPLATVLATTDADQPSPILAYQPYGGGRVVVVEGAGMWRWAFLPAADRDESRIYGAFWRSLTRWLVSNVGLLPSQRMALRTDKVTFSTDENVAATLLVHRDRLGEELPLVELQPENGESALMKPVPMGDLVGQFQVRFGALPEGAYRIRLAGLPEAESAAALFDVRGSLAERLDVRSRPDVMKLLAEESGGTVFDAIHPTRLAERFDDHRRRSQPDRIVQTPAWDRWWLLSGAFVLWTVAWGLRRRSGLI